jgi:hypothetical protein
MGNIIRAPAQVDMMARSRAESCLDSGIALGCPPAARPEIGVGVVEYFRAKGARGERGRFWPLHQTARMPR